jgi:hypothetical protein
MSEVKSKFCQYCKAELAKIGDFCPCCGKRQARPLRKKTEIEEVLQSHAAAKIGVSSKDEIKIAVKIKPPPTAVKTIRELIYWEYAKLIAHSAGFEGNYRFIMSRYMQLKNGKMKWSRLEDDVMEFMTKGERICFYCGSKGDLTNDHLIPLCKGGPDNPINIVPACKHCNSSKLDKDIFEWYFLEKKKESVPKEVWKRYLKLVYDHHTYHRTIDKPDLNQDGKLDIQDVGAIFKRRS